MHAVLGLPDVERNWVGGRGELGRISPAGPLPLTHGAHSPSLLPPPSLPPTFPTADQVSLGGGGGSARKKGAVCVH